MYGKTASILILVLDRLIEVLLYTIISNINNSKLFPFFTFLIPQTTIFSNFSIFSTTYRGVRVFVTIRIENREDVPFMGLSEGSDLGVSAVQQFIQYVQNGSRSNPFSGVNSSFKDDSGLLSTIG